MNPPYDYRGPIPGPYVQPGASSEIERVSEDCSRYLSEYARLPASKVLI